MVPLRVELCAHLAQSLLLHLELVEVRAVDELLLRGASLDDVFLALTGRHAEAENPETEEQA